MAAAYYMVPMAVDLDRIVHDRVVRPSDLGRVLLVWAVLFIVVWFLRAPGANAPGAAVQFSLPKIKYEWEKGKTYYRQAMDERDDVFHGPDRGGYFLRMPRLWDPQYPPRAAFDEAMLNASLEDTSAPPSGLEEALRYKKAAKNALDAWRVAVNAATAQQTEDMGAPSTAPSRKQGIAAALDRARGAAGSHLSRERDRKPSKLAALASKIGI